jgi:hypothetical protein
VDHDVDCFRGIQGGEIKPALRSDVHEIPLLGVPDHHGTSSLPSAMTPTCGEGRSPDSQTGTSADGDHAELTAHTFRRPRQTRGHAADSADCEHCRYGRGHLAKCPANFWRFRLIKIPPQ